MKLNEMKNGESGYVKITDIFTYKEHFLVSLNAELNSEGIPVTRNANRIQIGKKEVWANLHQIDNQLPELNKPLLQVELI